MFLSISGKFQGVYFIDLARFLYRRCIKKIRVLYLPRNSGLQKHVFSCLFRDRLLNIKKWQMHCLLLRFLLVHLRNFNEYHFITV